MALPIMCTGERESRNCGWYVFLDFSVQWQNWINEKKKFFLEDETR